MNNGDIPRGYIAINNEANKSRKYGCISLLRCSLKGKLLIAVRIGGGVKRRSVTATTRGINGKGIARLDVDSVLPSELNHLLLCRTVAPKRETTIRGGKEEWKDGWREKKKK